MSTTVQTDSRAEVTLDTDTVDTIAILEADAAVHGRPARAKLTWSHEDEGEWVANYGGYFGGSVDKRDGRYVARTRSGSSWATSRRSRRRRAVSPTSSTSCSRRSSVPWSDETPQQHSTASSISIRTASSTSTAAPPEGAP